MNTTTRINTIRIVTALLLTGLAGWQEQWLMLAPAAILAYQAYRSLICVVCEAGFCESTLNEDER